LNEIFTCEGFQIAKAKRLDISKDSRNKSTIAEESLMINIVHLNKIGSGNLLLRSSMKG
jgi:hypothetical protein